MHVIMLQKHSNAYGVTMKFIVHNDVKQEL